jgi:ATP-binding cassette subfamily F protein uup
LARLFARPANVLVLDEPTNDRDIDTLELLEEMLQQYDGTVFLVSHDRAFVDNVVTSIIACESEPGQPGLWREYEGSVEDWLIQSERARQARDSARPVAPAQDSVRETSSPEKAPAPARRKLSYKEQRELEGLPAQIETLEQEQASLEAQLADGSLYASDPPRAAQLAARLVAVEEQWMAAMERLQVLQQAA